MLQPNLALTTLFPDRWLTSHAQHNSCLPLSFKSPTPSLRFTHGLYNPSIQTVPACSRPLAVRQPLRQSVRVFPHLSSVYSFCSRPFFLIRLFHLHSRHSTNVLTVNGLPLFREPLPLLLRYINQFVGSSLCIRPLWPSLLYSLQLSTYLSVFHYARWTHQVTVPIWIAGIKTQSYLVFP